MRVTGVGASPTLIMWCFFFGLYLRAPLPFSLREEFRSDAGVELGEPDSGSEPYSSPVLVVLPQPH
jgi:hypothetical protein